MASNRLSRFVRPVVTPGRYFRAASPDLPVRPALAAAGVGALASLLTTALGAWAIVAQIPPSATYVIDGERVAARAVARDAARRTVGWQIPGAFFGWAALVVVVHVGSLLDDSAGDFTDSTAVASWAYVPLSVGGVVRGLALVVLVRAHGPATTFAALQRQVGGAVAALQGVFGLAVTTLSAAWLGYVIYRGLQHARGLDDDAAALVGGTVALFVLTLGLV